ncbi:MAG TPA: DUF2828 family protein, partial [Mobilitalea sp.]|nr:DUF2828 family protein [Mobilitalea sp.]
MLEFLKREANSTYTENGAVTNRCSESFCLDFFYQAGALRGADDNSILTAFLRAYSEDPSLTMKILFFARDIRSGLGERRIFRTCMKWLAANHPQSALKNLELIPEFGRYDDLLSLLDTSCEKAVMEHIARQLAADTKAMQAGDQNISLLAKWLPSVNTSNEQTVKYAKKIA